MVRGACPPDYRRRRITPADAKGKARRWHQPQGLAVQHGAGAQPLALGAVLPEPDVGDGDALEFINRAEVLHFLGPPGTGKSHLATAIGVAAVKAGRSVYRCTLAELIDALAQAEREGRLPEKIRFYARSSLLIVNEIGYLPITSGGANLFFQLGNARYEKGAMILTSNRGFAEWGDPVVATALLYAQRIGQFNEHLQDEYGRARAAETFRSLVDQVTLMPDNGELAIVLRGDLGAILRFTAGKKNPDFLTEAEALDNLLSQGSLVAGAGFEPAAFRL